MLNRQLDEKDIISFIKKFDTQFDKKLSNYYNYSRVVSLAHFQQLSTTYNFSGNVAVISGSKYEPELSFINNKKTSYLNFSENNKYDLDRDWNFNQEYDIVICNQVLEHVFNQFQAFKNLLSVTKPGGYIYITIPTINCIHGEPHFYSPGFHPRFLERLATTNNLDILHLGSWGNKKYLINCVLGRWLTYKQLKRYSWLRFLMTNNLANSRDGKHITDTWILARKPIDNS